MNDSAEPERFGCGMHADDRLPFLEPGVRLGAFSVLGRQPIATAANRRPVRVVGAGRVGAGSVIGCHAVVYAGVFIGREACIGDHAVIREDTRIGNRCVIGCMVDIQYSVTIGDDVRILNQTQIAGNSVIGRGTFIGPGTQSANDLHVAHYGLDDYQDRGQSGITIGEYVFIGAAAVLLPGIKIGDRAIVGAGAVVTKDVAAGETVMGFPARRKSDAHWVGKPGPLGPIVDRWRKRPETRPEEQCGAGEPDPAAWPSVEAPCAAVAFAAGL